jgi:hypothetical protein
MNNVLLHHWGVVSRILQPTSWRRAKLDPWELQTSVRTTDALPWSPSNCVAGHSRMISEIMEVPFPLANSSRLMSFLTFHISMFFSVSFACGALMMGNDARPVWKGPG